jgi:hypothetical protein
MDESAAQAAGMAGGLIAASMAVGGMALGWATARLFRVPGKWKQRLIIAAFGTLGGALSGPVNTAVADQIAGPHSPASVNKEHSPLSASDVEGVLANYPPYAVLKQYYPTEYANIVQTVIATSPDNTDQIALGNSISPHYLSLVQRQLQKADDANVIAYLGIAEEQAKAALAFSPKLCASMEAGVKPDVSLEKVFSPDLMNRIMVVSADVLRQSATNPFTQMGSALSPTISSSVGEKALARLTETERSIAMRAVQMHGVVASDGEARAYCDFVIATFEQIRSLPSHQSAAYFRTILKE